MTPLKLAEIEAEKRYPLYPNPDKNVSVHAWNEIFMAQRAAFIAGAEWVGKQVNEAEAEIRRTLLRRIELLESQLPSPPSNP